MTERYTIENGLAATIWADGAELCSWRDAAGRELLWDGGAIWPSHSPVLFPIVGEVANDRIVVDGRDYQMKRHGLARRRQFRWAEQAADRCRLVLEDDAETRAAFPFAFRLTMEYAIADGGLTTIFTVDNPGSAVLPASVGAHPAFRWPLFGGTQAGYRIEFAEPEPDPIHRLRANLLDPAPRPTPIVGSRLDLHAGLFADDALIMLTPRSRSLRFVGPDGGLAFEWSGFEQLALWQKPGAGFLCIEPWYGYASPSDWSGAFTDKPGLFHLQPGATRRFSWTARPV